MLKSLIESAWAQFQTNQFASGGLVLMVLGGVLAIFRSVPGRIWGLVRNRVMAKLVVTSDTQAYNWVQHWLSVQPYTMRTRNVQLVTESSSDRRGRRFTVGGSRYNVGGSEDRESDEFRLSPGEGVHIFWWKSRPVWLSVSREKNESAATSRAYLYTTTLTSFGMSRKTLQTLVEEAKALHAANTRRTAGIWVSRWEDEWEERPGLDLRPLSTLVYDADIVDYVIGDAQRFLHQELRYRQLGIPFRRGYLLYGPPGTGKTSLAMALAHTIQRELCILPLSRPLLDDQTLMTLMTSLPSNALVLIEDIDTIFEGRTNKAGNQVTFSGLLNALDGALSQDSHMILMTTNRRESVDAALLRPGRVDVQVHIGLATTDQARELFLRFFPLHADLAGTFAKRVQGSSMAQLQESLVRNINDPRAAALGEILREEAA
jgi:mitochondrial chaperone BCS1